MSFLRNVRFQFRMCKFPLYHYSNTYRLAFFFKNLARPQNKYMLHFDDSLRQRHLPLLHFSNRATPRSQIYWPEHFPEFVEEGCQVMVKNPEKYKELGSRIMYKDIEEGEGEGIMDKKQKVSLHYCYYDSRIRKTIFINESFEGCLDQLNSLAHLTDKYGPGLKEGIKGMKPKGRRIIIIPLQEKYGVFGVELHSIQSIHRKWNPLHWRKSEDV